LLSLVCYCAAMPPGIFASTSSLRLRVLTRSRETLCIWEACCLPRISVASHSWISSALLAVYLACFIRRDSREQTELESLYGAAFLEYASRVPAFWPRLSPASSGGEHFSWALYLKNREYEAAIGLVVAMVILWGIMLWRGL